eukprot:CAMPEP_0119156820 /NCGR_PEP_ID=MMETSP1310-20130426/52448_1 /TAXON_ID=464262 /ORGANISM="Genus nov. species nov., Strain RCC2339" /LENGTH=523 /DNA_ID=CAMNT_0007149435 /DNA_START=372 /DNA_END=1943 /DNA_ORIENTATION=-
MEVLVMVAQLVPAADLFFFAATCRTAWVAVQTTGRPCMTPRYAVAASLGRAQWFWDGMERGKLRFYERDGVRGRSWRNDLLRYGARCDNLEVVRFACGRGARVTQQAWDVAVQHARTDVVFYLNQRLLGAGEAAGAAPNGQYLQARAAQAGRPEMAKLLVHIGLHPTPESLAVAAMSGSVAVLETFYDLGVPIDDFLITQAILSGKEEVVFWAQSKGRTLTAFHIDTAIETGCTQVVRKHVACGPHLPPELKQRLLLSAVSAGDIEFLEQVLELGANVDGRIGCDTTSDHEGVLVKGLPPIVCAARRGQLRVVELLVRFNAKLDATDSVKRTSLLTTAERGYTDIATFLIRNGANVHTVDQSNRSPLTVATAEGHAGVVKVLLEGGANHSYVDDYDEMAIHIAARVGNLEIVKLLLEYKADVNSRDGFLNTALHRAIPKADSPSETAWDIVECLLNSGANVNARNKGGATPLHHACFHGWIGIAKGLVQCGADVNVVAHNGKTPLDLSRKNGFCSTWYKLALG